jgi:hypothetical protein
MDQSVDVWHGRFLGVSWWLPFSASAGVQCPGDAGRTPGEAGEARLTVHTQGTLHGGTVSPEQLSTVQWSPAGSGDLLEGLKGESRSCVMNECGTKAVCMVHAVS